MTVGQVARRAIATAVALGAALALAVPAAHAEVVGFSGGHANWGLKQSFRDYIETGPADGQITVAGGTIRNDDGTFRFPVDGGSYDTNSGAGTIELRGSILLTGHHGQLEIAIANPRIEVAGAVGTLIADVSSKALSGGETQQLPGIDLADLDLSGAGPATGDQRLTWSASPARLAADAAPVFEGFYVAGELLDPLDVTASYGTPSVAPAAPSGLATTPATPGAVRNPRIVGTAPAGTVVKVYRNADCTGPAFATASAAQLADPGIAVTVPTNATATFSLTSQTADSASPCSSPVSYTHVAPPAGDPPPGDTGGGGATPPPPPPRATPAKRAGLAFPKRAQVNPRTRTVRVATIRCHRGPCTPSAKKTVRVKIAGKWFRAAVLVPKRIATGKSAHIGVRLSRPAAARLAGRTAKLRIRVAVSPAGGQRLARTGVLTIARR